MISSTRLLALVDNSAAYGEVLDNRWKCFRRSYLDSSITDIGRWEWGYKLQQEVLPQDDQESSQQIPKQAKNSRLLYFKLHAMITTRLVVLGEEGIVNPNRCFAAMQKLLTTDEMLLGEAGLDRCRGQVVRVGHKL